MALTINEDPLKALDEVEDISADQNITIEECEECSREEYTITTKVEKRYLQSIVASQKCKNHGLLTIKVELESVPENLFRDVVAINDIRWISSNKNGAYIIENYDVRGQQLVLRKTIMQNGSPWIHQECYLVSDLTQYVVNGPSLVHRLLSGTPESINWGDIRNVQFNVDNGQYFLVGDSMSNHVLELENQGLADISDIKEESPTIKRWSNATINDSWGRAITYKCQHKCDKDTCKMLRARGCYQIGTKKCLQKSKEDRCIKFLQSYKCTDRISKGKISLGNKNAFCLDGNCINVDYETDKDMLQALGALSVAKEVGSAHKDGTQNIHIFNGTDRHCTKEMFGAKNCCSLKGWWPSGCDDHKGNGTNSTSDLL
jgi:hypothetical protein